MPNQEHYILNKTFDRNEFPAKGEYEACTFHGCDFSNQDLSSYIFIDCLFNGCNFSLAKLHKTSFQDITFKDCKMIGLHFDHCNEFGLAFSFDTCQLNHSSFYKMKIKKTIFRHAQLLETDFAEADLTSVVFDDCNLSQAVFDRTILEKADFRTAYNYSIDLENNQIKKAKFSASGIRGLLDKYDIEIEN